MRRNPNEGIPPVKYRKVIRATGVPKPYVSEISWPSAEYVLYIGAAADVPLETASV